MGETSDGCKVNDPNDNPLDNCGGKVESQTELHYVEARRTVVVSFHGIIAAIAYWGIRQSPYTYPKNLTVAMDALEKRMIELNIFKDSEKKSGGSYLSIDTKELEAFLTNLIKHTPEIAMWNITQKELDMGITDAEDDNRPVKWGAVLWERKMMDLLLFQNLQLIETSLTWMLS